MKIQDLETVTSWQPSQYPSCQGDQGTGVGGGPRSLLPRGLEVGDIQWTLGQLFWLFNYENTFILVGKLLLQAPKGLHFPGTLVQESLETRGEMPGLARGFLILMEAFIPLGQCSRPSFELG